MYVANQQTAHRRAARYAQFRLNNGYYVGTPWTLSGFEGGVVDSYTTSLDPSNSKGGDKAIIKLRESLQPNEISGTVQLSKDTTHLGLIIDLQGYFQPSTKSEQAVDLLPPRFPSPTPNGPSRRVFHRFCGGPPGVPISSPSFRKYLFHLLLPEDTLPPSFTSGPIGKVKYQLRVWMESTRFILLGRKTIEYLGQLTLPPNLPVGVVEEIPQYQTEIEENGIKAVIGLARGEYCRNENVPFTLKIWDGSKQAVRKVEVGLWRRISCVKKHYPITSGEMRRDEVVSDDALVDCVTYKRFLRREVISRSGKFSWSKIQLPTYVGMEMPKLKIKYFVQVNITTPQSVVSTQLDVIIGTNRALRVEDATQLQGSMLSLFPPGYSTLSSRAGSVLSLETLPPHYDDIQE